MSPEASPAPEKPKALTKEELADRRAREAVTPEWVRGTVLGWRERFNEVGEPDPSTAMLSKAAQMVELGNWSQYQADAVIDAFEDETIKRM